MRGVISLKTKGLKKELETALRKELKEYLEVIGSLTGDEKKELCEWVAVGNSVNDNPYMLYDESGWPMDFINGCRISNDIFKERGLGIPWF
jgi:hypothetical protein